MLAMPAPMLASAEMLVDVIDPLVGPSPAARPRNLSTTPTDQREAKKQLLPFSFASFLAFFLSLCLVLWPLHVHHHEDDEGVRECTRARVRSS